MITRRFLWFRLPRRTGKSAAIRLNRTAVISMPESKLRSVISCKRTAASQRSRFRLLVATICAAAAILWIATGEADRWKPEASAPLAVSNDTTADDASALSFFVREGMVDNHFYRRGPVAAHLLLRSGISPRIVVAFPAGNSGAALWFEPTDTPVTLALDGEITAITEGKAHGIEATIIARGVRRLTITRSVLGSIRVIRDVMRQRTVPDGFQSKREVAAVLSLSRRSVKADRAYRLRLEPLGRTELTEDGAALRTRGDGIRFRLAATTEEPPLTPIPEHALLGAGAADDPRARQSLAFLSYEEKLLAGSWRFLTYFGRDTLISTRLLMPVLTPGAIEAGLGSVMERLSPSGEVAHEEDIGEFPALRGETAPAYDYKMIDDDFMLAPIVAHYLLESRAGKGRRAAFLARTTSAGVSYADAIRRNLEHVLAQARPYAAKPGISTLLRTKEDLPVGNWRDSEAGLGGGRIPYDVNGILVPAALEAAVRLYELPELADSTRAGEAARLHAVWAHAGDHFLVAIEPAAARQRIERYAEELGIPARPALGAVRDEPVAFPAVALDRRGQPVPVMNTDDGFTLLFAMPSPAVLRRIAGHIERPLPAGLWTPVGVVVANPAYAADPELRAMFSREHYHGVVVWSWQQALSCSGIARQLERRDLDGETRKALRRAETALWRAIDGARENRTSELWSWDYHSETGWQVVPFGQRSGHQSESNAAQLWSTVFLAITPPSLAEPRR